MLIKRGSVMMTMVGVAIMTMILAMASRVLMRMKKMVAIVTSISGRCR